jgi:dual specificity MAP kinase phosphatase
VSLTGATFFNPIEPFRAIEKGHPHLVNIDSVGNTTGNSATTDLFEREIHESLSMTKATEVVPGFWAGNTGDIPECPDEYSNGSQTFDFHVIVSTCSNSRLHVGL